MKKTTYVIIAAFAFLFLIEIGSIIYIARTAIDPTSIINRADMEIRQQLNNNDSIGIETTAE